MAAPDNDVVGASGQCRSAEVFLELAWQQRTFVAEIRFVAEEAN
jgi:hypothetical protein